MTNQSYLKNIKAILLCWAALQKKMVSGLRYRLQPGGCYFVKGKITKQ